MLQRRLEQFRQRSTNMTHLPKLWFWWSNSIDYKLTFLFWLDKDGRVFCIQHFEWNIGCIQIVVHLLEERI
jgi:hypothetical protein